MCGHAATPTATQMRIATATVRGNAPICREHFRMTVVVPDFPVAAPGQFVQISPLSAAALPAYPQHEWADGQRGALILPDNRAAGPFLPRAFSIGEMRARPDGVELDIIFRVIGTGTAWLSARRAGEQITVLGPCGRPFDICPPQVEAWLVMGGVGMPPLLWLARVLRENGRETRGFLGARTAGLVPLTLTGAAAPDPRAEAATYCSAEFNAADAPLIVATDDGSCGYHGTVLEAVRHFHDFHRPDPARVAVYTCGPERMMEHVARFCDERGIRCQVSMERPMACGVGTCQSCIVTVREPAARQGWRYALCCQEGPVFDAERIVWSSAS